MSSSFEEKFQKFSVKFAEAVVKMADITERNLDKRLEEGKIGDHEYIEKSGNNIEMRTNAQIFLEKNKNKNNNR